MLGEEGEGIGFEEHSRNNFYDCVGSRRHIWEKGLAGQKAEMRLLRCSWSLHTPAIHMYNWILASFKIHRVFNIVDCHFLPRRTKL